MKRIYLIILMVMTTMVANAQYKNGQYLACTGNGILLRTGPGKNYPAAIGDIYKWKLYVTHDSEFKQGVDFPNYDSIGEGFFVADDGIKYLGKKQNGYLYVECIRDGDIFDNETCKGWLPEKYLRAACSKCNARISFCYNNGPCPRCHGRGY